MHFILAHPLASRKLTGVDITRAVVRSEIPSFTVSNALADDVRRSRVEETAKRRTRVRVHVFSIAPLRWSPVLTVVDACESHFSVTMNEPSIIDVKQKAAVRPSSPCLDV